MKNHGKHSAPSDNESNIPDNPHKAIEYPGWHRASELSLAAGFLFKVKLAGWTLFCKRWNAAPFLRARSY